MIIRAVFWLAVISLFMPHEPDLGYGRPGGQHGWMVSSALAWIGSQIGSPAATGTGNDNFAVRSIAEARAEIEQAERERARARHSHD